MLERIFDALSLALNNILGLFAGMLIAVIALSVGPRNRMKLELTRANVYLMTFGVVGMLLVIFLGIQILRHGL